MVLDPLFVFYALRSMLIGAQRELLRNPLGSKCFLRKHLEPRVGTRGTGERSVFPKETLEPTRMGILNNLIIN